MKLETIIINKLKHTRNCKFKAAWIPKGWACVEINTFAKELAEELKKEVKDGKAIRR